MLKHHRMRYRGLTDLLALFRGELAETDLGCYWAPMPAPPMPPSPNAAR
ncbi:MAG: hypothetical protein K9M02_20805 [Thiohalocapsa sp.]|nr:hypothetical protein [Thiohalocapsa sp.]